MTAAEPVTIVGPAGSAAQPRTLSAPQRAILAAELLADAPNAFTLVSAVRVRGLAQWSQLEQAALPVLARHDVFTWRLTLNDRYDLAATGGCRAEPAAVVLPVDLREHDLVEALAYVRQTLDEQRQRVVDVLDSTEPTSRLLLFRLPGPAPHDAVCALVTHHMFVDEYSTQLLWAELFGQVVGDPPALSYDDRYAHWAHGSVQPTAVESGRRAALELARHLPPLRGLPDPAVALAPAGTLRFLLPASLNQPVALTARRLGVSPFAPYGAALAAVLRRRLTRDVIEVALGVSARTTATSDVIGCFVSSLPVVSRGGGPGVDAEIRRWQAAVRFTTQRASADVEIIRSAAGGVPPISVAFERRAAGRRGHVEWVSLPPPDGPTKADWSIFLAPGRGRQSGDARILWRTGRLDPSAAAEFVHEYLTELSRLVRQPAGIGKE